MEPPATELVDGGVRPRAATFTGACLDYFRLKHTAGDIPGNLA